MCAQSRSWQGSRPVLALWSSISVLDEVERVAEQHVTGVSSFLLALFSQLKISYDWLRWNI